MNCHGALRAHRGPSLRDGGQLRRPASAFASAAHYIALCVIGMSRCVTSFACPRPSLRLASPTMIPVETLLKEALELPAEERTELVGQLLRSLPATAPPHDEDTHVTWEGAQAFLED
jgi:hypothetical protein